MLYFLQRQVSRKFFVFLINFFLRNRLEKMSFSNFYLQYIKPLKFEQGLLPFSDYVSVISASVFYLIVILVLKEVMKNSDKKFNLTSFVVFHNFFLCGLSLAMLLGVAYELG